jgi:hypothetical protein
MKSIIITLIILCIIIFTITKTEAFINSFETKDLIGSNENRIDLTKGYSHVLIGDYNFFVEVEGTKLTYEEMRNIKGGTISKETYNLYRTMYPGNELYFVTTMVRCGSENYYLIGSKDPLDYSPPNVRPRNEKRTLRIERRIIRQSKRINRRNSRTNTSNRRRSRRNR